MSLAFDRDLTGLALLGLTLDSDLELTFGRASLNVLPSTLLLWLLTGSFLSLFEKTFAPSLSFLVFFSNLFGLSKFDRSLLLLLWMLDCLGFAKLSLRSGFPDELLGFESRSPFKGVTAPSRGILSMGFGLFEAPAPEGPLLLLLFILGFE